jgi:hypothetical protein
MNKQTKLAIIHFNALEWYPPVMNLLDFIAEHNTPIKLVVISNRHFTGGLKQYDPAGGNLQIARTGSKWLSKTKLRSVNYFIFYLNAFLKLLLHGPAAILYYDTISAAPAILYKKYVSRNARLMVHYHEYVTPTEYQRGMKLTQWQHRLETRMYQAEFSWISQTNEIRLQKFIGDNKLNNVNQGVFHIMPNYPPVSWRRLRKANDAKSEGKIKLVYAGALGYDNMYVKEVIEWVGSDSNLSLDIYSYNIDSKAQQYLDRIPYQNIRLMGGCDYQELPQKLSSYDAGLVFYKPFSENTIHAVSNKVFEYVACGLDVMFSNDMTYTREFATKGTYPIIVGVDFNNLKKFDIYTALQKDKLVCRPSDFYCETVYQSLINEVCLG